jgi:biotin carboxylase
VQGGQRRRLLVLGAGRAQLGVLAAARARGLYVVAVDRDPGAPGFRYADRRAIVSIEDEPAIDRLAAAERVHGIVAPGIDAAVAIAARVAAHHSISHPIEPIVGQRVASKLRQRERFAEVAVPTAPYRACASLRDVREAALALGLPVVVKPPNRQGQRGLTVAYDGAALEVAFERAVEASQSNVVLVERNVAGPELSVNAFSIGGLFCPLTVTDRIVAAPPAFGVARAHVWPSVLPPRIVASAVAAARTAAEALGIREGLSYTQVLIRDGEPVVVETAARLGTGHDAELCDAAIGIDINRLAVAAALGEQVSPEQLAPASLQGGACIRFLTAPSGVLESVGGLEEAEAGEGVVWVRAYRQPGDLVAPLRSAADQVGAVLTVGASRAEAMTRADVAAGRVRFRPVDVFAAAESR